MEKLRVAHIGTGNRATKAFLPVMATLDEVELVAVCGRSREKAEPLGKRCNVPWYDDAERMVAECKPDMVTAIVNCSANLEVARKIAPQTRGIILETPIEIDLAKGAELIELTKRHNCRIEIAENTFRFPWERFVRKALDTGMFGRVLLAYNDLYTHGYHAVAKMRAYVGFDVPITSVTAFHHSFGQGGQERQGGLRAASVEFANRAIGMHGMIYGVPGPYAVGKAFVAERGWLSRAGGMVEEGGKQRAIRVSEKRRRVGKVSVCQSITARWRGGELVWENPFADKPFSDDHASVAAVVLSMARAVRDNTQQEYSLRDALVDYEVDSAMCSSAAHGRKVQLPLHWPTVAQERAAGLY